MTLDKTAQHWDNYAKSAKTARVRYWECPFFRAVVEQHVSKKLGGSVFDLLSQFQPMQDAISVGCGPAAVEIGMLKSGIVGHFHLAEVSEQQLALAGAAAQQEGVYDRITWHRGGALPNVTNLDLVYWRASLHHMLDTREAVRWSINALCPGGVFLMDEYIGPNRLQMTLNMQRAGEVVRSALHDRYLADPYNPGSLMPRLPGFASVEYWLENDPSECADSEAILPAIKDLMAGARIWMTGGVVYHYIINDILTNFDPDSPSDQSLLRILMYHDDLLSDQGLNHFAVALWQKPMPAGAA
jgi:SAM-dependent methyltransferase